jgi:very-short-patch-repair endonuclease
MISKLTKEQEEYLIKHSTEKTSKEWMEYFNCKTVWLINKRLKKLNIKSKKTTRKQSESSKRKISEKRKKWLKDNPDKHPWRNCNKFKSKPCELVKDFLRKQNIQFIAEYDPNIPEANYSIDIAIPDKLIALEINGNQHYNSDGTLKLYYQKRHDLLKLNGWNVYEIHYSHCFKLEKWVELINSFKIIKSTNNFDYLSYVPKQKYIKYCEICSKQIRTTSDRCKKHSKRSTKIIWPSIEDIRELVWKLPIIKIAENLGVSDKAVSKFCKKNNIDKPKRGYWSKIKIKVYPSDLAELPNSLGN